MPQRIAILGSTGSIGRQTLEVIQALPDRFTVVALAAGRNVTLLNEQIHAVHPTVAAVSEATDAPRVAHPAVLAGEAGLVEIVTRPDVDLVVVATSGKAGFVPTLAAIEAHKPIAIANKEVLVMAGALVMAAVQKHGVELRPIDSEHSALWQCLRGEDSAAVARLILTSSGGPFRTYSAEQLYDLSPAAALHHPTWVMGQKITIDSATLMNKGFEIIEAHWLFGKPYEQIDVMVHPQSIIHSMVQYVDGAIKAQLSAPDMRLAIQYALNYPARTAQICHPLDLIAAHALTFEAPDTTRFPCLRLAREAGMAGGTYPTVLCAADEEAVALYLAERIQFSAIPRLIEQALNAHTGVDNPTFEDILAVDAWARMYVQTHLAQ
ncbi:MAG TPA: 1-deoxy-D-xylulose-5-phosphate reductoisomerase [Anaerolineae bacterium]|nr:1-deoxy-D-xylulose-5-phosphate reductoisomerase [Anaerolineae bacterium]HQH38953.1 1-deoxy-D-xylulose-5-phosphate reductoisomerase [Anaerolineae bacterium]